MIPVFMDMDTEVKAYKFWNELKPDERVKFLTENHFWEGFSYYLYDYLSEDLKDIIRLKMA